MFWNRKRGLSTDEKLYIKEEVERVFNNPPAEILRLIQGEVEARVSTTERQNARVRGWIAVLGGALFVGVLGISWADLRDRSREMVKRTTEVEVVHSNAMLRLNAVTNTYVAMELLHRDLTNRIAELSKIDNLVTAQQLQKEFQKVEVLRLKNEEMLLAVTTVAARAGDALAFDRLEFWATNRTLNFSAEADAARSSIVTSLVGPFHWTIENEPHIETRWDLSLGFENAKNLYQRSQPEARISIIETIWNATNFPYSDRLKFLGEAALHDSSITGRRYAVALLNLELKTNFVAWYRPDIQEWLKSQK